MSDKKKKYDRNKPRIMPGLSTSSKELTERVRARQARPDTSGNVHSTDKNVVDAFRKSRVENARDYVQNAAKIDQTKKDLATASVARELEAQKKAKIELQKKDRERQEALDKIIKDSKDSKNA